MNDELRYLSFGYMQVSSKESSIKDTVQLSRRNVACIVLTMFNSLIDIKIFEVLRSKSN